MIDVNCVADLMGEESTTLRRNMSETESAVKDLTWKCTLLSRNRVVVIWIGRDGVEFVVVAVTELEWANHVAQQVEVIAVWRRIECYTGLGWVGLPSAS